MPFDRVMGELNRALSLPEGGKHALGFGEQRGADPGREGPKLLH